MIEEAEIEVEGFADFGRIPAENGNFPLKPSAPVPVGDGLSDRQE